MVRDSGGLKWEHRCPSVFGVAIFSPAATAKPRRTLPVTVPLSPWAGTAAQQHQGEREQLQAQQGWGQRGRGLLKHSWRELTVEPSGQAGQWVINLDNSRVKWLLSRSLWNSDFGWKYWGSAQNSFQSSGSHLQLGYYNIFGLNYAAGEWNLYNALKT